MTLPAYNPPDATLFGETEQGAEPKIKLGFVSLVSELFTEPTQLFQKLRNVSGNPWVLPLVVSICASMAFVAIYALKVDADALLRPVLEANPQLSAAQVDNIIEMQSRWMLPMGIGGALLGSVAGAFFAGLLFWGIGVVSREGENPTYMQGVTLAVLGTFVAVPSMVLGVLMCLLRPVGGLRPDQILPSNLGFFLTVENPKLGALLGSLDLFTVFSCVVIYVGARHYLRCKVWGASLCVVIVVAPAVMRILFAK